MADIDPKQIVDTVAAEEDAMEEEPKVTAGVEVQEGPGSAIKFLPAKPGQLTVGVQVRKVSVPQHRFTPLKKDWMEIYTPVVTHLKLQIRMNTKSRQVELRTSPETTDIASLDKAAEFVRAFILGFEINDALSLLRLEDLYLDSFSFDDVKTLHGDNLSRAIGRVAGKDGKTKFTIENATRTRLVLADKKVHILGSFHNIKVARDAVVDLIIGSPPGKVYAKLRSIAARLKERF